jgi:hypothetical protein
VQYLPTRLVASFVFPALSRTEPTVLQTTTRSSNWASLVVIKNILLRRGCEHAGSGRSTSSYVAFWVEDRDSDLKGRFHWSCWP